MLTAILKSNTIVAFVLSYLFGGLMLVLPYFFLAENSFNADMLYAHWAFAWLQPNAAFIPYICTFIIAIAAILSRLRLREAKQVLGNSNLAMVAFVSLIMTHPKVALARPDILVTCVIIIATFLLLLSTNKQESVLSEIFHVGLLFGTASLFTGQTILFLLPAGFSILVLRSGNWREWAVLSLGIVMTAIFIMMVAVWDESPFLAFLRVIQSSWSGSTGIDNVNTGHLILLPIALIGLSGLFGSLTIGTVTERNIMLVNSAWIIGGVLIVLLLGVSWQNGIILIAFPLSVLISRSLEKMKRWWLADLLLLSLIAAPFVSILWPL
ncbi:MAG: DUF6427 family protein [Flavobacteriales bacterium]|nr:DUF6427 family protein [Flavobacteriales bacterium]